MTRAPRTAALMTATAVAVLLAACAPPESRRVQGGGPGADIGNRSVVVEMHAGSEIYPTRICGLRGEECTGPLPTSGRERQLRHSEFVLQHMGRGGALRRVIYELPPYLGLPDPAEIELPFPGPSVPGDAPGGDEQAPTEAEPGAEPETEADAEPG